MKRLFVLLQYCLPQHGLSRLFGRLARARSPRWLVQAVLRRFVATYQVDLAEAQQSRPEDYETFNDFFTRALKAGARPLCSAGIACPADGVISECGGIDGEQILQAKGRYYGLASLLAGDEAQIARYRGGRFMTIYLSPRDYHRVHMPLTARLRETRYVPGDLFSVNGSTAAGVHGLFARNERLVCEFSGDRGDFAMVLVGAMIVAGIETVWAGQMAPAGREIQRREYLEQDAPMLQRGQEMGRFLLGSTVILLLPPDSAGWNRDCVAGRALRLGEQISP